MVKDILIVGDLGAGVNVVKNILSLGNYYWPYKIDKFDRIRQQYGPAVNFESWLNQEYTLRFWSQWVGVDLSDNLDVDLYLTNRKPIQSPIVFINHSAFYQQDEYKKLSSYVDTLFVSPTSDWALEWQIRAYCEKKTVELMHDFCFESDREYQIQKYKNEHGEQAYQQLNICNMIFTIRERQKEFQIMVKDDFLRLESLLVDEPENIINWLNTKFKQDIPINQGKEILLLWRNKHWPLNQTSDWKYHFLFH